MQPCKVAEPDENGICQGSFAGVHGNCLARLLGLPTDIRELLNALPNRRVGVGKHSILHASVRTLSLTEYLLTRRSLRWTSNMFKVSRRDVAERSFGGCCSER